MTGHGNHRHLQRGVWAIALFGGALSSVACNRLLGIHSPIDGGLDTPGSDQGTGGQGGGSSGPDGGDAGPDDGPDGGEAGQPTITPASLPDALYNAPYAVTFAVAGGSAGGKVWSLTRGPLPQGLDLRANGTLAGVPLQEGPFSFDVMASDLPPGTGTATSNFTLSVRRKYWLVFRANNVEALDSFGLYAVDVRNPAVRILVSSNIPTITGTVDKFEFSPDGRWLAYVGYQVVGLRSLYVVDMSGPDPGQPRAVNDYGTVNDFAWSPDSHWLAFPDEAAQGIDILVADVTRPQTHPARGAAGVGTASGVGFVTNDLLAYGLNQLAFTRRPPGGDFGIPQMLTVSGSLVRRWPDLQSGLFASPGESCQDPAWTVIDFHDPLTIRTWVGYVSVSPGRDHVAHRANPDFQYAVYPAWDTQRIVTFPSASHFCAPGSWSHDGTLFVSAGDADTLQVTHIDGATGTTGALAGSYGTVAENGPPVFSPDDRWLGFSTSGGAFVAPNDHGTLGPIRGGGIPVTAPFGEPRLAFAPNSTQLASGEADAMGRPASTRLTDLRQDPPAAIDLYLGNQNGSGVFALGWSIHSTELALVARDGAYPSPTNLYLYNAPLTPVASAGARNVTAFDHCDSGSGACQMVTGFAFQP